MRPLADDAANARARPRPAAMRERASTKVSRLPWGPGLLAIVVLVTAVVRLRLLEVPLDRDEGEYAYVGQLLLEGVLPYAGAYNMKLPGIYGAYAASLALFGRSTVGVHLGLLVVNAATIVLVYALVRSLYGPGAGAMASATFAALSLSPRLLGTAAYAEHFVLLPALGGLLVLVSARTAPRTGRLVASGLLLGLALLMKQSGALFAAGAAIWLLLGRGGESEAVWAPLLWAAILAAAAAVPYALLCLLFIVTGTFGPFWFWTVSYALQYGSATDLATGLGNLVRSLEGIAPSCSAILVLTAVGVVALVRDGDRARRDFVLVLLASSAAATATTLYFRPQYFVLMLAAVSILAALGTRACAALLTRVRFPGLRRGLLLVVAAVALAQPLYAAREVLFELSPVQVSRAIYGANPFPESVEIARYIRERTTERDRIAVIGSEPQIYFYAERRAATGYIYTYALMEPQPYATAMQHQMISEIEAADPRFVVFVNIQTSWLRRQESDQTVFRWLHGYLGTLERVGVVELWPQGAQYRWGQAAAEYTPRSEHWLAVFERRRQPRTVSERGHS